MLTEVGHRAFILVAQRRKAEEYFNSNAFHLSETAGAAHARILIQAWSV
jgi:hypothetical protein